MKNAIALIIAFVSASFAGGPVSPPGVQVDGTPDSDDVLVYSNGVLVASGVVLSNAQYAADLSAISNAVFNTTNGPNQLLKLDENGKVGTNAIPAITIVYSGGSVFE